MNETVRTVVLDVQATGLNITCPRITLEIQRGKSLFLFVCMKHECRKMLVRAF
jgi:hypothetical protein